MWLLLISILLPAAAIAVDPLPTASGSVPTVHCGHATVTPLVDEQTTPHDSILHSWPWVADMCYQCKGWFRFHSSAILDMSALDPGHPVDCGKFLYAGGFIVGRRWLLSVATDGLDADGYRVRVGVARRSEE